MTRSAQSPPSPGGILHCQDCRAPLAGDQRYCLNCGATVRDVLQTLLPTRPHEPSPLRPPRRLPLPGGARGTAAALGCALGVGVLAGAFAGPARPGAASAPRRVVVVASGAGAPAPAQRSARRGTASLQAAVPPPPVTAPPAPPVPPPPPPPPPDTAPPAPASAPKTKRKQATPSKDPTADADPAPAPAAAPVKHVVVIALADKGFAEAFGPGSKAPYLATELRKQGLLLRRYYATAHGSLPNLIGLLSGQAANPQLATGCAALTPFAVAGKAGKDGQARGTGCVFPASVPTLPAQLEARKLTWHAYVEGADQPPGTPPTPCSSPAPAADSTPSAVDRNPFLFFAGIAGAADCTAKVTGLGALAADLASAPASAPAQAPALTVVLPGACLAGREGACPAGEPDGLARADGWLRELVPQLLAAPAYADDTMIVITFDQARASGKLSDFASCCGQERGVNEPASTDPQAAADGGGRVGALVLSPRVKAGRISDVPYNHFALLRTIEDAFGLDPLGLAGARGLKPLGEDVFGTAGAN